MKNRVLAWAAACLLAAIPAVGERRRPAHSTGPVTYFAAFHACDEAAADCRTPANHRTHLAQSSDGASWSLVPRWTPIPGSVPDVIRRGNTLFVYTASGELTRFHLLSGVQEAPVRISIPGGTGYVDPSLILDGDGRLVLFYLEGTPGSDPARCPAGQTTCTKRFRSAVEVAGSDGAAFVVDAGDRVAIRLETGTAVVSASDPDVFFDGTRYLLYISHGSSISVWSSSQLRGAYSPVPLPNGLLTQNTGGVPAGHYDRVTNRYWTYAQTRIGGSRSVIRRAVHSDFSRQLDEGDWSVVLSGPAVGLTGTTSVESPSVSD